MSFAIPESWSDEVGKRVTLYAKARNLVALDPVTLEEIRPGANSALGAVLHELHVPDASCERSEVQVGVCDSADTTELHDAPMTADDDGGSSGGGTDEGGGSGGRSSGSGKDHSNNKRSGKAGALAGTCLLYTSRVARIVHVAGWFVSSAKQHVPGKREIEQNGERGHPAGELIAADAGKRRREIKRSDLLVHGLSLIHI